MSGQAAHAFRFQAGLAERHADDTKLLAEHAASDLAQKLVAMHHAADDAAFKRGLASQAALEAGTRERIAQHASIDIGSKRQLAQCTLFEANVQALLAQKALRDSPHNPVLEDVVARQANRLTDQDSVAFYAAREAQLAEAMLGCQKEEARKAARFAELRAHEAQLSQQLYEKSKIEVALAKRSADQLAYEALVARCGANRAALDANGAAALAECEAANARMQAFQENSLRHLRRLVGWPLLQ